MNQPIGKNEVFSFQPNPRWSPYQNRRSFWLGRCSKWGKRNTSWGGRICPNGNWFSLIVDENAAIWDPAAASKYMLVYLWPLQLVYFRVKLVRLEWGQWSFADQHGLHHQYVGPVWHFSDTVHCGGVVDLAVHGRGDEYATQSMIDVRASCCQCKWIYGP